MIKIEQLGASGTKQAAFPFSVAIEDLALKVMASSVKSNENFAMADFPELKEFHWESASKRKYMLDTDSEENRTQWVESLKQTVQELG